MSEIRTYLEAQAAEGGNKWLRDGYTTLPAILEAVRAFRATGGTYNEDAERYLEEIAGDLPEHYHHGHEKRHPLTYQLEHEVYIANGQLSDEKSRARIAALEAEGFTALTDARPDEGPLVEGGRYEVTFGVTYVGRSVPSFPTPIAGRLVRHGPGFVLLPKGHRTNGYRMTRPAMYRALAS